ncbi:sigma-70 family RNA polymerase sigma factor [Siminovitchia terrae]|uniref:Sigma-70 family RNA polymerase sigma factor n=1 Tax=Siminovitchia terrae TaxID=1914933 RepID=A0A429XA45_SIMTE|nr:sigma-70 family RNA polymerase sigma factor [Siminovitchia terrae]RST60232.1 sigma-70 family RNA polymerase sigma factor [Siminovitchia terrae]
MPNWADKLIQEYSDGKSQLLRASKNLDKKNPVESEYKTMINSMVEDMDFAIEWLETGRQPGTYRGVDKRSVYQIRSLENMDLIPDIADQLDDVNERKPLMTREEKIILQDILSSFSRRERQCYLLNVAQGMSWATIADELGISKSSVQTHIKRARNKVEKRINEVG